MADRRRLKLKRRVLDRLCNPNPKRYYIHQSEPLFRRAFKQWLKAYRDRTGVRLEITGRHRHRYHLRLVGYPDCLAVSVSAFAIDVAVIIEGRVVDYLLDLDMSMPMRKKRGGRVFDWFSPSRAGWDDVDHDELWIEFYPSLEAYWQDRQFNRFGDWLTGKLAQAKWLSIYRDSVKLTIDEPKGEELIKAVQLR